MSEEGDKPVLVSTGGTTSEKVIVEKSRRALQVFESSYEIQVRYLNHARLVITIEGLGSFATDPWIIGPAFCNGWWLAEPSPLDAFDVLNGCDFIYISHNHSDHLHEQSLSKIRRDMPILTPSFDSGSTVRSLRDLGFDKIVAPPFGSELVDDAREIAVSVLHSGDFRDDSGLLIQAGRFTALLTVDSNALDFGRLPENLDLLCSSFAAGASGFPLCFENKEPAEQERILVRNRGAIRAANRKCIEQTSPGYFMPYAGFFLEKAHRDEEIRVRNVKNKVTDYAEVCSANGVELLNVQDFQIHRFSEGKLKHVETDQTVRMEDLSPEQYIEARRELMSGFDLGQVESYFINSGFFDQLVLEVKLTDDEFLRVVDTFVVEFDEVSHPKVSLHDEMEEDRARGLGKRYLSIRVREFEFKHVVSGRRPWEDLSIGFQMRIYRQPDIYNSDFWNLFTNVYISHNDSKALQAP